VAIDTRREGCDYCHAELESAVAYWGRWGERGSLLLAAQTYPDFDPSCASCADDNPRRCSAIGQLFDLLTPVQAEQEPYVGWLATCEFRGASEYEDFEKGPKRQTVHSSNISNDVSGSIRFATSSTRSWRAADAQALVTRNPLAYPWQALDVSGRNNDSSVRRDEVSWERRSEGVWRAQMIEERRFHKARLQARWGSFFG
jgi:hypothetical protein